MKLKPVVAGLFYPGKRRELQQELDSFQMEKPGVRLEGEVVGLLLPHAGYRYSGVVAALGYQSLPKSFDTVVVAGPSHHVPFKGISLFWGEAVGSPLEDLPVDQEACRFLSDFSPSFMEFVPAYAREHSVEVHFPLIQRFMPGARVVPLITGQGLRETVEPLAAGLEALRQKKEFLFVASSDLSHNPEYKVAVQADHEFLEALCRGDEKRVNQTDRDLMGRGFSNYHCTHCGHEPVSAMLKYAKAQGAGRIQVLNYRNSGDVTGDHSQVVGYAAVAFSK